MLKSILMLPFTLLGAYFTFLFWEALIAIVLSYITK